MAGVDSWVLNLMIFVLAVFVGQSTVSNGSHALHKPLTAMNSMLSGVIIIGALTATGTGQISFSASVGFLAIIFAAAIIVGGLVLSQRMLSIPKEEQERD